MASTFSALKIELIGTGDQPGTWGATTNTNLGTALEQAIVGRAATTFPTDADLTITLTNVNTTQVARHYILNVISGVALTSTRNLVVPSINKPYIIENNTTGGQSIIVKTAAGTGVTVPNGRRTMVYADSVNVVAAENYKPSLVLGTALPVTSGGTGVTTSTGTGAVVLGTGPTISNAALTGVPTAPTATVGTNTTQLASTAFVISQVAASVSGVSTFSAGTTGFTPTIASSGDVVLAGTLTVLNGGTGSTTATGTGSVVRASSPVLTSPNLGTPSSINLSNGTSLPIDGGTTGTLSTSRGGTGSSSLTGAGIVTTGDTQTITGAKTFTGSLNVTASNPQPSVWPAYAKSKLDGHPAFVFDGGTGASSISSAFFGGAGGGNTVVFAAFVYGNTSSSNAVGDISSTGTSIVVDNAVVIAPSDYRLKDNIKTITNGLEVINQLRPVSYIWKQENKEGQGFIAHELQQVLPASVSGVKDQTHPDGRVKPQGIDYSTIIPILTAAIQEQQTLINNLTARVAALEIV